MDVGRERAEESDFVAFEIAIQLIIQGAEMARKNLLKGFKRPKGINFEHSEIAPDYGKFVCISV